MKDLIFLYGPPGSGKTTIGEPLAQSLGIPFTDLDRVIEAEAGKTIAQIFTEEGEPGFRQLESQALGNVKDTGSGVIALGGGALLDPVNRQSAEVNGQVLLIHTSPEILVERMQNAGGARPLVANKTPEEMEAFLAGRQKHYDSFPLQLNTASLSVGEAAWQAQVLLGSFRVSGMGQAYDVRVQSGGIACLGEHLRQRGLQGPVALVSDEQVAACYAPEAIRSLQESGYAVNTILLPPGESTKTVESVFRLWEGYLEVGLDRRSTVVAMGGGVVTDLAGFAAATFLRGVTWVAVPTSLLGMVDASLGGKTGADLPQGKNLVGAFHPPRLVLADPQVLATLPDVELRCGLAEALKHGVIGDLLLFERCQGGIAALAADWTGFVRRAMAVKVRTIQRDPYETGERAALNLGHTVGHAVEHVSGYRIRHGEAVAIGMAAEARLSEELGLAEPGLAQLLSTTLARLGLPVQIPQEMDAEALMAAMRLDKKRAGSKVRFALPIRVGEVKVGVEIDDLERIIR